METVIAVILLVGLVGAVGAWVVLDARKRKAVTATLVAPLAERGWTLAVRGDQMAAALSSAPFSTGSQRRCEDVIRSAGKSVVSFTYQWSTGSGKGRVHHSRRVTMLVGGLKLPKLEVETNAATAGGELGSQSVDFATAWIVRATDEHARQAILHERMRDRFMEPDLMGRSVFFEKGRIGLVDHVVPLEDIVLHTDAAVATLQDIESLIPDSLRVEFA